MITASVCFGSRLQIQMVLPVFPPKYKNVSMRSKQVRKGGGGGEHSGTPFGGNIVLPLFIWVVCMVVLAVERILNQFLPSLGDGRNPVSSLLTGCASWQTLKYV